MPAPMWLPLPRKGPQHCTLPSLMQMGLRWDWGVSGVCPPLVLSNLGGGIQVMA